MTDDMHTCSYHCERPECIRQQRDELRDELTKLRARIEAAPVVVSTRNGIVRTHLYHEYPSRARVRLLVEDES